MKKQRGDVVFIILVVLFLLILAGAASHDHRNSEERKALWFTEHGCEKKMRDPERDVTVYSCEGHLYTWGNLPESGR